MAELREDDRAVPLPPREKTGALVEDVPGDSPSSAEPSSLAATATPPVLLESPHEVAAPPRESMAGAVTLEAPTLEGEKQEASYKWGHTAVLVESPDVISAVPRESMAGAVTLEAPALEGPSRREAGLTSEPSEPPSPPPRESMRGARTVENPVLPVAVAPPAAPSEATAATAAPNFEALDLPPNPRVRASFWYQDGALMAELVLMNERRELVRRTTRPVGSPHPLERVHAALLVLLGGKLGSLRVRSPESPSSAPEPETEPEEP
jgi:hypothetical protein